MIAVLLSRIIIFFCFKRLEPSLRIIIIDFLLLVLLVLVERAAAAITAGDCRGVDVDGMSAAEEGDDDETDVVAEAIFPCW